MTLQKSTGLPLILEQYKQICAQKNLSLDESQIHIIQHLDGLYDRLHQWQEKSYFSKILTGYFGKNLDHQGIYIYGDVGRGKTFLMDLFFDCVQFIPTWRVHFHAFMQYVHQELKRLREERKVDNPLESLVNQIIKKSPLLCFDEFHVTDIADAMILRRFFQALFDKGIIVVATSNYSPDKLYPGGLHRERFLPFIDLLNERFQVLHLAGKVDFRQRLTNQHPKYYHPINDDSDRSLKKIFQSLTKGEQSQETKLIINSRELTLPQAANGVALIPYQDLCEAPLSAADYIEISNVFHTIILSSVPIMTQEMHNEVKRFITLIDILYDKGTTVIISASAPPQHLYTGQFYSDIFTRTISRLHEMTHI